MANLAIRCKSCGNAITAAVKSLKWIRCLRCGRIVRISAATIIDIAPTLLVEASR